MKEILSEELLNDYFGKDPYFMEAAAVSGVQKQQIDPKKGTLAATKSGTEKEFDKKRGMLNNRILGYVTEAVKFISESYEVSEDKAAEALGKFLIDYSKETEKK